MEYRFHGNTLKFNKVLSDLDRFVIKLADIINSHKINYVVVSGYVSILFGRTRTTEDVDMFIEKIDFTKFKSFVNSLIRNDYWILNTSDVKDAFDMLVSGLAIRIAEDKKVIPNLEIKFPKKKLDFLAFKNILNVVIGNKSLNTSRFELQIPFKFWLGSEKDIEDAIHLYELFKKDLDKNLLLEIGKELNVNKAMLRYGVQ